MLYFYFYNHSQNNILLCLLLIIRVVFFCLFSVSFCPCLSVLLQSEGLSWLWGGAGYLVGLLGAEAAALQEVRLLRNNLVDAHARVSLEDRGTTSIP